MEFNLQRFEHAVYARQYEPAGKELMQLLQMLDGHYGNLSASFTAKPLAALSNGEEVDAHVLTRIASAISHLFADPNFTLSPQGQAQALQMQRWLATLFAITPFRNADHVLRSMNNLGWENEDLQLTAENLNKFALLAFPESEIPINLDGLWIANPSLAIGLCMLWLAPRFIGTPSAHNKREVVLGWMPEKIAQMDLDLLPTGIIHDVYMHCSYADRPDKHQVKVGINTAIRRKLVQNGFVDIAPPKKINPKIKPNLLVVLEWFNSSHSVYRCLSKSMRELKQNFNTIGMGYSSNVDQEGQEVFDQYINIDNNAGLYDQLRQIKNVAKDNNIHVMYLPAVGMFPLTIYLSNLRLAPLQVVALGHGASTMSPFMDYFAVDEDYIGDINTFSEKVIALPIDAMPFVASKELDVNKQKPVIRLKPETVHIAVALTTMKINPVFLQTCKQILDNAINKIHFEFFVGQSTSLMWPQIDRLVKQYLGSSVTVHRHQPYQSYMDVVSNCDMFINPFPYGNMNGIADMIVLGIAGICKSGPQLHEHIDVGLFKRLNLPEWTIAPTHEDYVAAAIRMIDNHAERVSIREVLHADNAIEKLYNGKPEILGKKLIDILLT